MRRLLFVLAVVGVALAVPTKSLASFIPISCAQTTDFHGFANTGGTCTLRGEFGPIDKTFTSNGDIPIIFVAFAGDTYSLSEQISNNTGTTWTDFHFVIGLIGVDPNFAVTFLNVVAPDWSTIT